MRTTSRLVSGWQICFLMFAVLLVSVPVGRLLTGEAGATREVLLLERLLPFIVFTALLLMLPRLRRHARELLSIAVPRAKRLEVALVAVSTIGIAFATSGARALWTWANFGAPGLSSLRIDPASHDQAVSPAGLMLFLLLGVLIAPILEELLLRGFIFRAFEREWHWVFAMLLTSVVFGVYHSYFLNAFLMSIVLVCVYRRTGSLRAAIYVHATSNLLVWYPALGQYLFPRPVDGVGSLDHWALQLGALAVASIAIPIYVWMSRDPAADAPTMAESHATLPK